MLDFFFGLFSHDLAIDLGTLYNSYFAPEAYSLVLAKSECTGRADFGGIRC